MPGWGVAASDYSAAVMSLSPIAYYRMNDTGTALADESGNGRSGTINGATTQVQGLIPGPNKAISLTNVSTSFLEVPYGAWMDPGQFSMCLWIANSGTGFQAIASRDNLGSRAWQFRLNNSTGRLEFVKIQGGVITVPSPSGDLRDSAKHFVGVTCDNVNIKLYQEGVNVATTATSTPTGATDSLRFGYAAGPACGFAGVQDEIALFNKALTAGDFAQLYAQGL
jgi:hypothetical protein